MKKKFCVLFIGILLMTSGIMVAAGGNAAEEKNTGSSASYTSLQALSIEGAEVEQDYVVEGDQLNVKTWLKNNAPHSITEEVSMATPIGNDRKEAVEVDGLSTKMVKFSTDTSPGDAGNYTARITSEQDDFYLPFQVLKQGEIVVSEVNADDVVEGDSVEVNATIENTGEEATTGLIEMTTKPDIGKDSTSVDLGAGESTPEKFTIDTSPGDAGNYIVNVSSKMHTNQDEFKVLQDPSFDVSDVNADDIVEGESLEVSANIENTGEIDETQTIEMTTNPDIDSNSTSVTLEGGGNTTETFTINTSVGDSGTITVTVSSEDDSDEDSFKVLNLASFAVGSVSAENVIEGENVEVTATIENTGDVNETQTIEMNSGVGTDSVTITLDGGQSTTETFTTSTYLGDAGSYTANVSSEDDSDQDSFEVLKQGFFEVSEVSAEDVMVEESVEITATIENTGEMEYTQTIEMSTDPDIGDESISLTLDGGESTTETFTIDTSTGDADSYTVTVSSEDDSDQDSFEVFKGAHFEVSDVNVEDVVEGDSVEVTVTIENTGDEEDTQTVEMDSRLGSDSISVTLAGGESTTETFMIQTSSGDHGSCTVTISSEDSSDDGSFLILEAEEHLQISEVNADDVAEGESVEVTATIENTGEGKTTQTIEMTTDPDIGGDTTSVELGAGESTTVTFTIDTSTGDADSYTVTVSSEGDSDQDTFEVSADDDNNGGDGTPGFTSALLLVAAVIAIAIYHKKEQ